MLFEIRRDFYGVRLATATRSVGKVRRAIILEDVRTGFKGRMHSLFFTDRLAESGFGRRRHLSFPVGEIDRLGGVPFWKSSPLAPWTDARLF